MKLLWHFNWTKTTTVLTSEQTWKRVALVLLLHMMTSLLVVLYMTHRIHTAYTAHLNVSSILAKHNDSLFGKAVLPHKVIIAGFNTSPFSRYVNCLHMYSSHTNYFTGNTFSNTCPPPHVVIPL